MTYYKLESCPRVDMGYLKKPRKNCKEMCGEQCFADHLLSLGGYYNSTKRKYNLISILLIQYKCVLNQEPEEGEKE
jgi:hypothetical protein